MNIEKNIQQLFEERQDIPLCYIESGSRLWGAALSVATDASLAAPSSFLEQPTIVLLRTKIIANFFAKSDIGDA